MENLSDKTSNNGSDDDSFTDDQYPKFEPTMKFPDPVQNQKRKDRLFFKKPLEVIPEKSSLISTKIVPSMGTRIDLQHVPSSLYVEGQPRPKFIVPKTKKQREFFERNRANTYKRFCKYRTVKMATPIPSKKVTTKFEVPSPEPSSAKVAPRKVTPTSSWLYPDPQTEEELALKKPKSGIIINETGEKESTHDYDSFDLVFSRKPRPDRKRDRKGKAKKQLADISEESEQTPKKGKAKKKGKRSIDKSKELLPEEEFIAMIEQEMAEMMYGEGEGDMQKDYLTKQFRRKVSLMSQSTSYQSKDYEMEPELSVTSPALDKYAQKFRRDSEIRRYEPKRRKFRRGTLESHSFTNIYQPLLKEFYFGSRQGTMHQGDAHLPDLARNMQGICVPVAAYCFSFLRHPNKWTAENIDEILDVASHLYLESINALHVHQSGKELKIDDLEKYCFIRHKKLRFSVEEPEVSGLIKSTDKTVFNLTKALNIFFARQKAGILQTQDTNIAIWKDKYFYFFDGKPRTKDLYYSPNGTAIMANFYDIPAIVTVMLQRSGMQNWPFVIYPIKVYKILDKDEEDNEEKQLGLDARSNYNILNENKAILLGSYDLGDKCFGFTRNKQSLPMAVVCLVYSRITPPSAWHKTTVDKIMIIGNQLYVECMECEAIHEMKLNALPAFFTVGPYIVEIYVYANRMVDMLYEKCNCQLKCSLEEFFKTNTNAIVQINSSYLAIWKQRNMFFCFEPYPRGLEGYKNRDGYACVSMHSNLDSLVDVVTHNFDDKDTVFNIHALKICKIHRDPVQSQRFPKHIPLDEFPPEDFKNYKMKKSRKPATEKPVTVDYSALAMRSLLMGETPDPSIYEIGSHVESLALEQIPPLLHADRCPPKANIPLPKPSTIRHVIADLDSPSLSDTQIAPPRPTQPKDEEEVPFIDMDSFELTQEEIELEQVFGEFGDMEDAEEMMDEEGMEGEETMADVEKEMLGQTGEGEDFYYSADEYAQVRTESLMPQKASEEINTELTYFPIRREVLYPTYIRGRQDMKKRLQNVKKPYEWDDVYVPIVPDVSKSEELKKETNFVDLPDDTQIIRGNKNISAFGEDVEFMAPFICVMADVVAKKYSILSWTSEIVDYVLKCGVELYNASKVRYDQVSKLEIPKISLGKTKYSCLVEYIFDSYTRQNILELAIDKILFVRSDMGVLVTPMYACAIIYKNYLYYMYDGFGNNEVGLSEGLSEEGTACFSRFKDVHSLVMRIMYNKKKRESNEDIVYTRFVLSAVRVKRLHPSEERVLKDKKGPSTTEREEEEELMAAELGEDGGAIDAPPSKSPGSYPQSDADDAEKKPQNKVGYQYKKPNYVIEGTRALVAESAEDEGDEQKRAGVVELQEDHFACLCACLMLLSCPIEKWDTKKVDEVLDHGNHVYSHADDLEVSEKRTIKNILIRKNFFDIIVRKVKIENWRDNKNLNRGIDTLMRKKMSYFIVQFADSCYVVHKSAADDTFHIFYPKGIPKGKSKSETTEEEDDGEESGGDLAGWLRCRDLKCVKRRLKKAVNKGAESYDFYTFEVTSIRKAPKDMLINYRLNQYDLEKPRKAEQLGKPFYEDAEWLKADPLPWSRIVTKNPDEKERGTLDNLWHNWDTEYRNDLYSMMGNIHQDSDRFPDETRGKQTLCNLVVCIGMLEIYDLSEWSAAVIDSILVNGNQYFENCIKDIKDEDYELSMDDLKDDCEIFPFTFKVTCTPIVEGTMFLVRNTQFNLYKALRFFFDHFNRRSGIITCTKSDTKKNVAFGKAEKHEYYMFEVDAVGSPMFLQGMEKAYILRMTSLNRLLHVLTLTLRGGDFYIFEIGITDVKPIS
ncbi:uncharacterized protein LOC126747459 isoform X2 [Anthonomus grandis grandis]|uniref:uncharacterized protein LOC126747459 isoform X2 n=1 Tax=Anthonomus grandis grandis TaxID=2921223 RepID=UPI0021654068|nr:uncharacterized protein LOC126747459 isoform X2 [Anthonomus grandis grandis]